MVIIPEVYAAAAARPRFNTMEITIRRCKIPSLAPLRELLQLHSMLRFFNDSTNLLATLDGAHFGEIRPGFISIYKETLRYSSAGNVDFVKSI